MITAVDTSVLIDVFGADRHFGAASANALRLCLNEGAVVASEVVWGETRAAFGGDDEFLHAMQAAGISFSPTSQKTATLAGVTWRKYRASGGQRIRVIADFLIGAHAAAQCDRLLTRDRGYYRKYFGRLVIVNPST
jgi:predicted nucleic acid-binding protein